MAGILRFIQDGLRELGRKITRRKLRSRQAALEKQRRKALSQLGRRAWEAKIDLENYADLRDQLHRLDERAGQLAARSGELQAQAASLQSRRAAELARFDQQSRPVLQKKTETDTALRNARARLSETERAINSHQARLKWLTDELARTAQTPGGQVPREPLLAEQKAVSDQLTAVVPVREALAAEVNALSEESRRLAEEISRIEAERKSTLAPIEAELRRVQQESQGATREISDVGREQSDRFTELGAALYGQKVRHPALEEPAQAVEALDRSQADIRAALDASLALTQAMPRWTMLKLAALSLLLLVVAAGVVGVFLALTGESPESSGRVLQHLTRRLSPGQPADVADGAVAAEESRKDEIVRAFLRDPGDESKRRQAVEILENDVMTVGSTADRGHVPYLIKILQRGAPELRAAAGHAIGMIGPAPSELSVLLESLNDPVPGVREGALAALEQLRDDSARLLIRRIHLGARHTERQSRERFRPQTVPDFKRLGVPIYEGASYLYYASDPEIGRAAFVTDAPLQKVLDYYCSRSGRPALQAEEFTRRYLGGTPQDPTGAQRLASESQAAFKRAMGARRPEAEIRAEVEKYAGYTLCLPQVRYVDPELYGSPSFVALEEGLGGAARPIRYVAVFEDRALQKTGFEVHVGQ
ncbi:MAG: HEAT repeat domain-containing protein [Acidobacteriota bacterium]